MNYSFSIITPIYKTPFHKLERLYNSLLNQTYDNWEWIVYDDSPDDYQICFTYFENLSKNDNRIKFYTERKNIGIIGEVKHKAFMLGQNDILVEVDHDDELVNTCLENLNTAYSYDDSIGFVYGHTCEIYENDDKIIDYGDNWAFGYGRYDTIKYNNKEYKVAIAGNINPKTIRHITGIPNHVRTWKRDVYISIGGHNKKLEVADDYELFIRTFLNTTIAKINCFTYIQYFENNHTNTQFKKNKNIQVLVNHISKYYNRKINIKFNELNINDYVFVDNFNFNTEVDNPEIEEYVNIIIPNEILKDTLINNLTNIENVENVEDNKYNEYAYSKIYNLPFLNEYKQSEHYSNIILWLAKLTNCQSYLELGIEYGYNIQLIKQHINKCVGVDIYDHDFDKSNMLFYHMTTDDFFNINNDNFDLIFIDADHNFEQLKIDFDNSLKILNKYGIIILHDTDPMVEELLAPEYCSDAYKIVKYIESKKNLNIITLPIHETGLSIVMKKNDKRNLNFLKK